MVIGGKKGIVGENVFREVGGVDGEGENKRKV